MKYSLGLLIAIVSIFASVIVLKQSISTFVDEVALIMVMGGTISVTVATLPKENRQTLFLAFTRLFKKTEISDSQSVEKCISFYRTFQEPSAILLDRKESLLNEVLHTGKELIELGFQKERIEQILEVKIQENILRKKRIANSIRSLAKYPPAFGLMGTVLGLVNLMRSVSDGANAQETGSKMAVALIATLYGLLVSNLIINPAGENLYKQIEDEQRHAEFGLYTISAYLENYNLLELQELLGAYSNTTQNLQLLSEAA